ncbi:MAG: OmpA family protein [Bacteroidetes bacterium]|nr:OmpA family protein [Bacteroidota bacterium]
MKKILPFFILLATLQIKAQDFMGLQSSNYAGVAGVFSNPANIVDNRLKFDMVLIGLNVNVDNNYIGVKRSSIKGTRLKTVTNADGTTSKAFVGYSPTWDSTRNTSPYYWKNNIASQDNKYDKSIYSATRIMLPSFMIQLNKKNAIAFNWGIRNYVNVDGISPQLAKLGYEEFVYPTLWFTNLTNKNLSVQQMSWAEYGLSYGHVFKEDGKNFFKAGATVKLLQGLEAAYIYIRDLEYKLDTEDTVSFFNTSVAYGHSDNLTFTNGTNPSDIYKFTSNPGFGFDIGGVYEWRPDFESHKYEMDGETGLWRRDQNKYKLKASLAVNDIGGIRFNKGGLSNDFTANVNRYNVDKFEKVHDINSFDSIIKADFNSSTTAEKTFKMALPTAINAQIDYHIWNPFYINLTGNITNFYKTREAKVHDFTTISLAPRFDHKWFGLTLPFTYNTLAARRGQNVQIGTMARIGPLVVGTNDMAGLFTSDVYGANLYFLLKIPIPYGRPHDRDKDKVSDKKDVCKDVPGVWEFMGCPDKDGDHIPDKDDKCPDVPGVKELQGCPDKDGDGITDAEDACPDEKGPLEFKGCPDRDGDKIIDKDDECPDDAGLAEFMGCPDKDGDGTPDKYDACVDVFGPKEYKGCPDRDGDGVLDKEDECVDVAGPKENKGCPWPDTDKDGILDKDDACPTVPGVIEFKGCPPPPPMKAAEQKILERAFASLEFATAKDIIKPKSFPSLNDLAKILKAHEADWTLKLSGHTDNEGNADKNMLLSEKRAKAVKAYLVKKGAKDDKIITEWFGQTMPIADNSKPAGRQKNRRVEMKIIYKETVQPK